MLSGIHVISAPVSHIAIPCFDWETFGQHAKGSSLVPVEGNFTCIRTLTKGPIVLEMRRGGLNKVLISYMISLTPCD